MNEPVTITLEEIKETFITWIENHPNCFRRFPDGNTAAWFVQNCVGDLIDWVENPMDWFPDKEPREWMWECPDPVDSTEDPW